MNVLSFQVNASQCFQTQKEMKLEKISYPFSKIISPEPGNIHGL